MIKHIFYGIFFAAALFFCGCVSVETLEKSDLTITELEEKMEKAMDPESAFRKADSYVQREMLKIAGIFYDDIYQIDLKYKKPNFLRLTTLENNQPIAAVIYNNGSAWQVDYTTKSIKDITGADLIRLNMLHKLTTPTEKYSKIFKDVKVYNCTIADEPEKYYKIVCNPENKKNTVSIYVSASDFLPRRISASLTIENEDGKFDFDSDCHIESYEQMDNVMIPQKSVSVSNGIESSTTVYEYKLNVKIPDSEFLPPIFTEDRIRNRMKNFGKEDNKRGFGRRRKFKN